MGDFVSIGRQIARLRGRKHWTQEALAEVAGLSVGVVKKLERGDSVSLASLKSLTEALGAVQVLVSDPMHDLNHAAAKAIDKQTFAPEVIEWSDRRVDTLCRLDDALGSQPLRELVDIDLSLIGKLCEDSKNRDLQRSLARMNRLAGWLARDSNDLVKAAAHYQAGIDLSRALGDNEYAAFCATAFADMAIERGDFAQALLVIEAATREADTGSPLHALLSDLAVYPLGVLGRHAEAQRMLDTADALFEAAKDRLPEHLYWMWQPSHRPVSPRGFIDSDPDLAERLLLMGLASMPSGYPRDRVLYHIGLAEAYLSAGRLDESVAEGLKVAQSRTLAPRAGKRLDALITRMPTDPVVQPLIEAVQAP